METQSVLNHPLVAVIENMKFLRTVEILPVRGELLEIHVAGADVLDDPHTVAGIEDVRSVEVLSNSRVYAFSFPKFVAYAVTDEMFIHSKTTEIFEGGRVRLYSKSHFRDYVSSVSWATSDFPGTLLHCQINTLDHTVDVVTAAPLELVMLEEKADN